MTRPDQRGALFFTGVAALALVLLGCGRNDPVQIQTEWQGKCTQSGFEPYPMVMRITERKGKEFRGILHWPTLNNNKTEFRGLVKNDEFYFVEYKSIQGSSIGIPTIYEGRIIGDSLTGTYLYEKETGTFYVEKNN